MKTNYTVFKQDGKKVSEVNSNLEYRKAKQLQMNIANLNLNEDYLDRPMRDAIIYCNGDIKVSIVKTELFERWQDGEIEWYEMFEK